MTAAASPVFILGALIVRDADDHALREFRDGLCVTLGKPVSTELHWSSNITAHAQRKEVARGLGELRATYSYVIVDKASVLRSPVTALTDHAAMYNYALRRLIERISWYVDGQHGIAILTFAHVRRFPYERMNQYLLALRQGKTDIKWRSFSGSPRISTPGQTKLLQLADLATGCIASAVRPDDYGDVEGTYIRQIADRIYSRPPGHICSYGLNVVGDRTCLESLPWWPL